MNSVTVNVDRNAPERFVQYQRHAARALAMVTSTSRSSAKDYAISAALTGLITLGFVVVSPECRHWFVLPVWLAGMIVGADGVRWALRKYDLYDPKGLVGAYGVHFFMLAPLIQVATHYNGDDRWMIDEDAWPYWLGVMGVINVLGVIAYKLAHRLAFSATGRSRNDWRIASGRAAIVLPAAVLCCGVAKIAWYFSIGGFSKFVAAKTEGYLASAELMEGTGWLEMLGNPLPILVAFLLALHYSSHVKMFRGGSRIMTTTVIIALSLMTFVLMGWTGSRSRTLVAVAWIVGIVHYFIRPISRKAVAAGIAVLLPFLYLYGFYKTFGADALVAFEDTSALQDLEESSGRTFTKTLLGDLARAEIQAYMLKRCVEDSYDYDFRLGTTYFDAPSFVLPQSWRPFTQAGVTAKKIAGSDIQFGRGTWRPGERGSSRVYGLAGEAMLNFSYWGIVPLFGVWGLTMGWWRKKLTNWAVGDGRLLIAPFAARMIIAVLTADAQNLGAGSLVYGAVPILCVFLMCERRRVPPT